MSRLSVNQVLFSKFPRPTHANTSVVSATRLKSGKKPASGRLSRLNQLVTSLCSALSHHTNFSSQNDLDCPNHCVIVFHKDQGTSFWENTKFYAEQLVIVNGLCYDLSEMDENFSKFIVQNVFSCRSCDVYMVIHETTTPKLESNICRWWERVSNPHLPHRVLTSHGRQIVIS